MPARSKELDQYKEALKVNVRERIDVGYQLKQLDEVREEIAGMLCECTETETDDGTIVLEFKAPSNGRIGALRLKADIALKLLSKRLPDLKAVEHSGEVEMPNRLIIERPAVEDKPTAH